MQELEHTAPSAAGIDSSDPRPVFEGDWASASGVEKGRHSRRVEEWKERTGQRAKPGAAKSQSRMAAGSGRDERHADDLASLEAIIHGASTLASDRIRAIEAKQRILAKQEQEQLADEHGPLLQLRVALDLIPPHERGDALGALLVVA